MSIGAMFLTKLDVDTTRLVKRVVVVGGCSSFVGFAGVEQLEARA